jgi:hypothetical protein
MTEQLDRARRTLVTLLDPPTDWSREQLEALPDHLVQVLAELVDRAFMSALKGGQQLGREECLRAVAGVIAEVGTDDEDIATAVKAIVGEPS